MDRPVDVQLQDAQISSRKKVSRRTRIIGSVIALLVLLSLGWLAWHLTHPDAGSTSGAPRFGGGGPGGRGGPATTVGIAIAEPADIPVVLDALGTVTPAATSIVRPQVSGVLKEVLFREGQMVKAGQLLATVDPRQFELALMQASGQRLRDEAQLDNARIMLQRDRTLLQEDSIAKQDVETQAALVKQLEGTVTTDRAAEGMARLNLSYCRIVAPISGRVGLRVVDIGNVVGTSDANGIAVITQVAPIDVVFAVPQDQVPEVMARAADGATLPATALDRTRVATLDEGRFSTLDNQVDTQTGTVRAKARFANTKLMLFPNQFVNVRLLLHTIQGGVMVPVTALRHSNTGDFVYVLNQAEHTASLRPVTRGQATVDKVEITTGLKLGEKVITEGADRLKDGAKVILPGDKPSAGGAAGSGGGKGKGKRWGKQDASASASADSASASSSAAAATAAAPASAAAASASAASADADHPSGRRRHRSTETSAP